MAKTLKSPSRVYYQAVLKGDELDGCVVWMISLPSRTPRQSLNYTRFQFVSKGQKLKQFPLYYKLLEMDLKQVLQDQKVSYIIDPSNQTQLEIPSIL